ncbi:oxygen-independent coproporphyrinogen III oxidase [Sphingosinicella sp. BN140058]|uniref:oxygen-independent coproporphyrinogen III oxidase n=1 Tax=Sphingosinicella sp. BN140058 TaxID=1892855 RepID=UPI0010115358|nr:oxygen-independent coproporphyrinogen III oxidase [Sphingosinicella sp. BN140058]QAY78732.1 oxygen-independent coproporphyrinogen III oxidase [Sphingosinicella sp. BN140058]
MSWTYHPELLARPVPRYTSYPTAAEFHDRIAPADMVAALGSVAPDADISLYLHIPYCHEICWYCGCNTGAANRSQRLESYLGALRAEIDLVAAALGGRGRIGRIAFGGGSPNALSPAQFAGLLGQVRAAFDAGVAPVSIELDPRTLTDPWFAAVAEAGIAKASLGVQTLDPAVQAAIGRVQPEALIRRTVDGLRRSGVRSINFDLMYGLPGQGLPELRATLEASAEMAPERIALFGYAHVPHMIPRQKRIDGSRLPDVGTRFLQAEFGHVFLTAGGYQAIGFDHFALPGDAIAVAAREGTLARNFQGFTEDDAEILIGLGASAISQFPSLLVQNEKNSGRYRMLASGGSLPAARGVFRDRDDRARGRIIEALLCTGNADVGAYRTGDLVAQLAPFEARGLLSWHGTMLHLTEESRPYARAIAAAFDAYRHPEGRRFSSAI